MLHPFMLLLVLGGVIKGYGVWNKSSRPRPTSILEKLKNKNEYPEEEKISQGQRTQSLIGYLFLAGSLTALMIVTEILRVKKEW